MCKLNIFGVGDRLQKSMLLKLLTTQLAATMKALDRAKPPARLDLKDGFAAQLNANI